MIWNAPSEEDNSDAALEKRLGTASDTARRVLLLPRLLSGQVERETEAA
jgi:hypothetical protein